MEKRNLDVFLTSELWLQKLLLEDGYSLATQGCLPWNMVATVHDIRRIGYWMARIGSMVAFWWRGNWSQSPGWCQMYDIFGAREWSESMWGYNVTETLAAGFMKFETPSETTYPFVGRGRTQVVKPQKHIKFHFVSVLTIFVSNSSPFIKFKFRAIGGFRVEWAGSMQEFRVVAEFCSRTLWSWRNSLAYILFNAC